MQKPGVIRNFFIGLGFLAMLAVGYTTTSVVTSCPADAAACKCSICVFAGPSSLSSVLSKIATTIVLPAIATATALIIADAALVFMAFTEQVISKFSTVVDNFIDWFDTFWYYNLKPAMQQQTRQLNTIDTEQSRGWAGFGDAVDLNRAHKEMAQEEASSHREYRPSETVCVTGTVTGGMTRGATIARAYNAAAPVEMLPRSGNAIGTAAANGRGADQRERWENYVTRYCDPILNTGASGCTVAGPRMGQDLDVTGQVFQKDTIDLTDPDIKKTVDDLVINIAEPFARQPVPSGAITSAGGQEKVLAGEAYKAKRQTVYDSLYHVISRRAPGTNMQKFLQPMRAAVGVDGSEISANPSKNEVMEVMMSERFRTGQYSIEQIDEPENNDREIVIQQAFQVMQLSDQLDLLDRYSLMLAADAGVEVQESKPFNTRSVAAPVK